jgi:phosphoglycerate dehydrogenase-like enzyme
VNGAFRVGVTRDLRGPDGRPVFDLGLDRLNQSPGVSWEFLAAHEPVLTPDTVAAYDALMIWEPGAVTAESLQDADRLAIIARFGMGLDAIDLEACSAKGVPVTTAPDAVRDAVPTGAIALLLSLAHGLPAKDRLVREGRWDDRFNHIGPGTNGRVLGIIGLGNVGDSVAYRAAPLGLRCLAFDPYADPATVRDGVELVDLETLLAAADYVCVTCPLTPETHHLLDGPRLALMRPGGYVINVARGPIVDTDALVQALANGHLAGAALDVFDPEPIGPGHPLLEFDNVIVTPHAIAYTTAAFEGLGRTAIDAVLAVHSGEVPAHVANPAALANDAPRATR